MAVALTLGASPALAARATPSEATVFVRLIGHVRVLKGADARVWREQLVNLREVEVGSGSGFIVSPNGLVVTNHHVITGEQFILVVQGQKLDVSIDVISIEVVLSPEASGEPMRRYSASVAAVDPELDLAILQIGGNDLPYVPLGDSDAVVPGDPVTAVGYPFGGMLDLDKRQGADTIPAPTMTTGGLSALRTDAAGEWRSLQISAALEPGNSGGPVVDAEGYVIGVAQARLRAAATIGFSVPVNRVKRLLQAHGLDARLPVELLTPGGMIETPAKAVRVPVPIGFDDRSPFRLHIEATSGVSASTSSPGAPALAREGLVLRIDRLAATESQEQLEQKLLTSGTFDGFQDSGRRQRPPARNDPGRRRMLAGHASGTDFTTSDPLKLVYAIVDLGREKIVARYVGPADLVAANRSLLHVSLSQLEATELLTAPITRAVQAAWAPDARSYAARIGVPLVQGWIEEPGLPWQCAAGLPRPASAVVMSPIGDFTIAFRAAWFETPLKDLVAAARTCSAQSGSLGETSYATRASAWGLAYQIEGVFVPVPGSGGWQLEVIAPLEKSRFVADLFSQWVAATQR